MADTPPAPGGRKILGLKPKTAIIIGVAVAGGALLWFWWKGKQAKTGAAASASASSSAAGGTGYQEQIDALEQEIDLLLQDQYPGESGGSGGTGGALPPPAASGGQHHCPAGQTWDDTSGKCVKAGGTTTKTPPKTTAKPKPAMPSGVKATKVTRNGFTISWAKDPNATSYRVRVTYQDKLVGSAHTTSGTSLAISGLSANRTYTVHVAAVGPGGTSSETNGPAVKTK